MSHCRRLVALTRGALPGAFCVPMLAGRQQLPSGLPLWAMISCAASERPDLPCVGRDCSLAEPWDIHNTEHHDASGFLDSLANAGGITSAPLLVPCHLNSGQEQHLQEV